ncbi:MULTISPECIES: chemotaxis protein CheD [Dyella]|uniref:Probable chemoreceptor glutamine deamidase CheD n=2 Tax=Dyella TaxID=231454 RepID=A0A4R0Z237_9GAMM|nr:MULTISPECIES: chemotaxis protein CheD [Dyella]TBR40077.1 hypothetical protein EYV96_07835 [Dyella terrae]TCI12340.1 hypothetical protein EZM97_03035 [Dyella soli]
MLEGRDIQVRMCEIGIGSQGDVLRAILGSCVGIGLLWRNRGICGLAHCLLPESPAEKASVGAKYVTDALPSLTALMGLERRHFRHVEAVVAGGACMVQHKVMPRHGLIGEQNVQAAKRLLAASGIRVVHEDVGGECGRQIIIDCGSYNYAVRQVARPA